MDNILSGLYKAPVFDFFEEISSIPRGSWHTEEMSGYLESFASERNLDCIRDNLGNVVIFKDGSAGRENEPPVIIQGHTDMVWEKDEKSHIDFLHDGLDIVLDNGYIYAEGTTLGGDDGIAVAMCLALLDGKNYSHPPIEAVFTVNEEVGMAGAQGLDTSVLKGKRMINLDSEEEGVLWVSCAGGERVEMSVDGNRTEAEGKCWTIRISGLHGGHSGAEIHKGYANANNLMGALLKDLDNIRVCSVDGGTMDNAITRDCVCTVCSDHSIAESVKEFSEEIKSKCIADPDLVVECEMSEENVIGFDEETTSRIITLLSALPSGVIKMSDEIPGLVETSLNCGIVKTVGDRLEVSILVRSNVDSERDNLVDDLHIISYRANAEFSTDGGYPAWEYRDESNLRDKIVEAYRDMYGGQMKVNAIHAGLECGIFSGKIKDLDCVSLGPDIFDIHTPKERMSVSSVIKIWELVLKVLEKI